jgi:putative ABC transport system permease protein
LENFAYRINLTAGAFILAGAAALIIAMITVSLQAAKAATANPVEALKYE